MRMVEARPIAQKIANKLDFNYQPRNFVSGSDRSQKEFYGEQKVP